MLSRCFLDFSVGVGAFVIGLSQISPFFSCKMLVHILEEVSFFISVRIIINHHWYPIIFKIIHILYKIQIFYRILLRCLYHFESDSINNMGNMRISDNGPSSVLHSQSKSFKKLKSYTHKWQTGWSQKWFCNKPSKLQFQSILNIENFWCTQNSTNQPKSTVELGYMCPRGVSWQIDKRYSRELHVR